MTLPDRIRVLADTIDTVLGEAADDVVTISSLDGTVLPPSVQLDNTDRVCAALIGMGATWGGWRTRYDGAEQRALRLVTDAAEFWCAEVRATGEVA